MVWSWSSSILGGGRAATAGWRGRHLHHLPRGDSPNVYAPSPLSRPSTDINNSLPEEQQEAGGSGQCVDWRARLNRVHVGEGPLSRVLQQWKERCWGVTTLSALRHDGPTHIRLQIKGVVGKGGLGEDTFLLLTAHWLDRVII